MNEDMIRYTFEILKEEGDLIEVRTVLSDKSNYSGYFRDVEKLIVALRNYDRGNIYFVLNEIHDACYSREQKDCFVKGAQNTTGDKDITWRKWILVDVDPNRPSGVSSTEEERKSSKLVIEKIYAYLKDKGFAEPVLASSGNGYHLLYRISMPNDTESNVIVKNFLLALDLMFSVKEAKIDTSVFNASRITKLYGTIARKGKDQPDRPHRLSRLKAGLEKPQITPSELVFLVSDSLPKPAAPSWKNNYNKDQFDLDKFIFDNGIKVRDRAITAAGEKFILETCLFNPEHKGKDAAIFRATNGALGYKCFHDSCSHYRWEDVRNKFQPGYKNNGYQEVRSIGAKKEFNPQQEIDEKGKKFLSLSDIKKKDRNAIITIKSGFEQLDKKIIGFNKGEITLWSGKNGSAKSTLINQICLKGCNDGFKFLVFSGELPPHKMKQWIHLQAAGRQYTKPTEYEGFYYTPDNISKKIDEWLDGKLYLYNNEYGNDFEQLMVDIEQIIDEKSVDCVVLDNLMAMNLVSAGGDKYQQQTRAIIKMCDMVKKKNIHLHIIAHPRKSVGFLRKDDISGSADLSNAVDNVIIAHRVNNDFEKSAKDFLQPSVVAELMDYTNILEVCKNRDLGIVDYMIGLYFEVQSKRLLNFKHENVVLGWQDTMEQTQLFQAENQYFPDPLISKIKEDYTEPPF